MAGYKGGGYKRKGVVYQGPTKPRGRPTKAATVEIAKTVAKTVVDRNKIYKTHIETEILNKANIPGAGLDGSTVGQFKAVAPLVVQGNGEANRKGNVISVKNYTLRYALKALPTTVGGSNAYNGVPFLVRVVVYRHKYNIGDSSPSAILDLNNSQGALTGDMDTYFRPYNKDEYMIAYSKTHRMSAPSHNNAGTLTPSEMDSKSSAFIFKSFKLSLPKKLTYNDNNSTPTNAGWYIGFAVVNTDESNIPSTSVRCTVNVEGILEFTD